MKAYFLVMVIVVNFCGADADDKFDSLKTIFGNVLFEDNEKVGKEDTSESIKIIKSIDDGWWTRKYPGSNELVPKDVIRQQIYYKQQVTSIHFAQFESFDEAYAQAILYAEASIPFVKGQCDISGLGIDINQVWCTNVMHQAGLIFVDGELCIQLFTVQQNASPQDMQANLLQLARKIIDKNSKLLH